MPMKKSNAVQSLSIILVIENLKQESLIINLLVDVGQLTCPYSLIIKVSFLIILLALAGFCLIIEIY